MPVTGLRGRQILDGDVTRADVNTSTSGSALITKLIAGTNITITSTGVDAGTGDVTINATGGSSLNGTGFVRMSGTTASYITGTSSQFVKADGSLDSSVYLTSLTDTLATVTSRGASTSTVLTFTGGTDSNSSAVKFAGYNQRGGVGFHGAFEITNTFASATNPNKFFRLDSTGAFQIVNSAYTLNIFNLTDAGALTVPGSFTAASIVRSGGTSSQFLKADGSVDSSTYITGNQSITLSGDATGSGTTAITVTLANSGVTAGTYRSVTVDAKGRVTGGTNPTTLSGYGITDALSNSTTSTQSGYFGDIFLFDDSTPSHYLAITNSANLTAARTLSINVNDADRTISLSGNLTVSAAATVSGTNTGDQTITLTGDVTGSGTGSFATTLANSGVTAGTYNNVTVNAKGLVTGGSNISYLTSYTETDTLATVTGRGASTSTAVTFNNVLRAVAPANTFEFALKLAKGNYADTGGHTTLIGFGCENSGWSRSAIGHTRTTSYDAGYLGFYVSNNTSNGNELVAADLKMMINRDGSIGIGTASPNAKLHVFDSTTAATVLVRGIDANLASSYTLQHGGGGARTQFDGTWYMSYGSAETDFGLSPNLGGGLVFWWQSGATTVNPMTLKRSGNVVFSNSVGIGIASPGYPLHVVGNTFSTGVISNTFWTDDSIRKLSAGAAMNFRNSAGTIEMILNGSGNLGVGVSNPTTGDRVEVGGTLRVHTGNNWDAIQIYTDGANGYIQGLGDETGLRIRSQFGNVILADNRGYVGIGLSNPQAILDVSHTAGTTNIIRVSNGSGNYRWRVDQNFSMIMTNASGTDTFSVTTAGALTATSVTETSTVRIKENIAPVTAALDKVDQLKPVSYNKKGSTTKEIGLIAEEVFDVYPEFVLCDDNGEPVGVHYSRLTAVLIESVKELKKEINELKNRN